MAGAVLARHFATGTAACRPGPRCRRTLCVAVHASTESVNEREVNDAIGAPQRPSSAAGSGKPKQPSSSSPASVDVDNSIGADSSTSSGVATGGLAAGGGARRIPYIMLAGLGVVGALETAYLSISKLLQSDVACPTSGCDTVLSSPFAELFGLPLPLYGFAAYGAVVAAAAAAIWFEQRGQHVPVYLQMGIEASCGVLATASAYLMYILHTALGGAPCTWCYASAGISFTMLVLLLTSLDRRQLAEAAMPGLGATVTAAAVLYMGFGPIQQSYAQGDFELPFAAPVVNTDSPREAPALARRLRDAGAKMYGAFWCSHCFDQKQAFGREAMADFPYVECYPEGWHRGVKVADACDAAGVKAFPTWVIGGRSVEGQLGLEQLQEELDRLERPQGPAAADSLAVEQQEAAAALAP